MNTKTVASAALAAAVAVAGAGSLKLAALDCYAVTGLTVADPHTYVQRRICVEHGQAPRDKELVWVSQIPTPDLSEKLEAIAGADVEFESACSSGKGCEEFVPDNRETGEKGGWRNAPLGKTLAPGKWRGVGCVRKPGAELFRDDVTSWPTECPQ